MEVGIHANMVDQQTDKIASTLRDVFDILCKRLSGNYGGAIEHLWIDFELIEGHAKPDGKPRFPFRFAKRVSRRSQFGLPPSPDYLNVGHFSVRPNFRYLLTISKDEVIPYCLNLIYNELVVLKAKEQKLGGFNSESFRNKFREECKNLGYTLNSK
jgi:hypothetical protein